MDPRRSPDRRRPGRRPGPARDRVAPAVLRLRQARVPAPDQRRVRRPAWRRGRALRRLPGVPALHPRPCRRPRRCATPSTTLWSPSSGSRASTSSGAIGRSAARPRARPRPSWCAASRRRSSSRSPRTICGLASTSRRRCRPALFADLREGRRAIRAYARDRRVLNLFSYTGAISVYAHAGGAREVCAVDVAAKSHARARRNFAASGFDPEKPEHIVGDAFKVLARFAERNRQFDLIALDPPGLRLGRGPRRQAVERAQGLRRADRREPVGLGPGRPLGRGVVDPQDLADRVRRHPWPRARPSPRPRSRSSIAAACRSTFRSRLGSPRATTSSSRSPSGPDRRTLSA
jgi:hypothetical protein